MADQIQAKARAENRVSKPTGSEDDLIEPEEGDEGEGEAGCVGVGQEHTGRWTKDEHQLFLKALEKYGKVREEVITYEVTLASLVKDCVMFLVMWFNVLDTAPLNELLVYSWGAVHICSGAPWLEPCAPWIYRPHVSVNHKFIFMVIAMM